MEDNQQIALKLNQKEVRCPEHGYIIGKYDIRVGLINATFYCHKCKFEYTFTIKGTKK